MAQIEAQDLLRLAEKSGELCFFDIEATGLNGDYNSVVLVSIKPWRKKPMRFVVEDMGQDAEVVEKVIKELDKFQVWVSYYGKGYDVPMLRTRALAWNLGIDLPKRHHLDLYYLVRFRLNTSRRSQSHVLNFVYPERKEDAKVQRKMTVSPQIWTRMLSKDPKISGPAIKTLGNRCDSDTEGLQSLYIPTKYLAREVTRG